MSTGGDACSENLTHAVEKLVMIWRFRGSSRHLVTTNHASDLTDQPTRADRRGAKILRGFGAVHARRKGLRRLNI